ncbi:hypothetical protein NDI76_18525 [Halogeometricum sp. S1BR25-6]|uniref:Halobacterial output domain-containing protein n=1 Tax=Halogeometricum salsisoli TaxID=2950536 RepID=A0ABU2GKE0_9EURY|nr:HalOD1 output domain-containing protein [Halogeometricum sp. S1BR25-6]MDS0300748.1 hypothetical protein [Halogeometricum sp. S1BR25-6]
MSVTPQPWQRTPTETVVREVASLENVDPVELDPLLDVVDPEALDALVREEGDRSRVQLRIEFVYHGYEVVITSAGTVDVFRDS